MTTLSTPSLPRAAIAEYLKHGGVAERVDALRLHQLTLAAGISIAPGPMFSAQRKYRNHVRLNFGHRWSPRLERAVRTVGSLVHELAN